MKQSRLSTKHMEIFSIDAKRKYTVAGVKSRENVNYCEQICHFWQSQLNNHMRVNIFLGGMQRTTFHMLILASRLGRRWHRNDSSSNSVPHISTSVSYFLESGLLPHLLTKGLPIIVSPSCVSGRGRHVGVCACLMYLHMGK